MTTREGRGFDLPPKGVHKESATADVVLIDPSTSLGMTESRGERHKRVDIVAVIPSDVEESVKKNPAKRLNYDHARRTWFPILR